MLGARSTYINRKWGIEFAVETWGRSRSECWTQSRIRDILNVIFSPNFLFVNISDICTGEFHNPVLHLPLLVEDNNLDGGNSTT